MRTIQPRDLFWLAKLAEIRPATVRQLDTFAGMNDGASRDPMNRLTELGLVRRYKDPLLPKRTWRDKFYGADDVRRIGKRPWIYETTLDGVTYLEGAAKCDQVLRNLDLARRKTA